MPVHIDSFSGDAASLSGEHRTERNVLAALKKCHRVSIWDLRENLWLDDILNRLQSKGLIIRKKDDQFPWLEYEIPEERMERNNG